MNDERAAELTAAIHRLCDLASRTVIAWEEKGAPKAKRPRRVWAHDTPEIRAAEHLFLLIQANDPEAKVPDPQMWAKEFDAIFRLDGNRTPDKVRVVIDWCMRDPFWRKVIDSPASLRKNFDKIRRAMNESFVASADCADCYDRGHPCERHKQAAQGAR